MPRRLLPSQGSTWCVSVGWGWPQHPQLHLCVCPQVAHCAQLLCCCCCRLSAVCRRCRAPSQEHLQKAKALLEKQKLLQAKLKKLPLAGAGGAAAAAGGAAPTAAALAASANPLAPGGVDPALIAAKAARAVEIASKWVEA
jgi:hypothetical protein